MKNKSEIRYKLLMWLIILISMIVAVLFCNKKQGFHFDENYSYYSTNITNGLWPTENEWKDVGEIRSEFQVMSGETLNLGLVKVSQTFDVHPPLYYYVLRVVCFLTKNTYSKWQGLFINLVFYFVCLLLLWKIADIAGKGNKYVDAFTLAIFGLSPGFLSSITFIRMYVMLTMFCFGMLLVAMKAFQNSEWSWIKTFLPTFVICFMGFLTHYYFIIFAFFVAAYSCLYLVFHKETRAKAFIYGGSVGLGIVAAILYYPACLSHIFRGYRGNDATQAFMDMSNTTDRINFFVQMLNDYTFSGFFFILVLIIALMYLLCRFRRNIKATDVEKEEKTDVAKAKEEKKSNRVRPEVLLLIVVALGYFLVVCKTAIVPSNPAEALRYESPIYGLIILLAVLALIAEFEKVGAKIVIPIGILSVAVVCQIVGLTQDKVFFVYSDAPARVEWADNHKESDIVYIYSRNNQWMIWDDSPELMEYNEIFFVPVDDESEFTDNKLVNSKSTIVYACRSDATEQIMQRMVNANDNFSSYGKIEERLYVDIYELK